MPSGLSWKILQAVMTDQMAEASGEPAPDHGILTLEQIELAHARAVLDLLHWNISRAARALGIDRRTLYRKMLKHKIQKPE